MDNGKVNSLSKKIKVEDDNEDPNKLRLSPTQQQQIDAGEDLFKDEKPVFEHESVKKNLFHDYKAKISKIAFINTTGNFSQKAETVELPWYIILPKGRFRYWWNFFTFFLSVFILFIIPVDMAFNLECVFIKDSTFFLEILYLIISGIFLVDILINCLTAAFNNKQEYEIIPKRIFVIYMKTELLPDLICAIPWNKFENFNTIDCYRSGLAPSKIYYFMYLFNIYKLMRGMEVLDEIFSKFSGALKFLKIISILLYFTNFIGCFFTGISNTTYKIILDSCGTETCVENFYLKNFENLYFYAWYFGMIFLSGNELETLNNWEKFFLLGINLASMIIAATIFGSVAVMIEGMGSGLSPILQQKLDVMNEYMRFKDFEPGFFVVIEEYLNNLWLKQRNIIYEDTFFDDLSVSLHKLLLIEQWKNNYFNCSKFVKLISIEFFTSMIPLLKPKIFMSRDIIVAEGDISSDVFFNSRNGFCSLQIGGNLVKFLGPWEYFGEIAIFLRMKRRTGTVTCLKDSDFLMIESREFEEILMDFPNDMDVIGKKAKEDLMSSMKLYPSSLFAKLVPSNAKKDYLTRKTMYLTESQEEKFFWGAKSDAKVNLTYYKNSIDQIDNILVDMKSKLTKKRNNMDYQLSKY